MIRRQISLFCCVFLLSLGYWFMPIATRSVSASVDLLYFIGTPGEGKVQLEWETATEIDHAGFFLSRSTEASGGYVNIGEFIPAQGDSITGSYYSYVDNEVNNGILYYYILESWSVGNTVEYSDPISVTPGGAAPTPTATVTRTSTPTQSPTPQISPTPTLTEVPNETQTPTQTPEDTDETHTPTVTVTNTSTPAPTITSAPTSTPTLVPTGVPTSNLTATMAYTKTALPTTTLIPLPTIIVIYPKTDIIIPTVTLTPSPLPTETQEPIDDYVKTGFKVLGVAGLVCVVGMLWLLLVIWIVLLVNRVRS